MDEQALASMRARVEGIEHRLTAVRAQQEASVSKAASKQTMEKLHEATARAILSLLVDANGDLKEPCEACGRANVDPRVLSAGIKFLRDNGIESLTDPGATRVPNLPSFEDEEEGV